MEILDLIQLLKFSDEAIGRYITFFLSGSGALSVLVMTQAYRRNFKKLGKIILTICMLILIYGSWSSLVYYHDIYNATVDALQTYMDGYVGGLAPLLAENGAISHKPLHYVHVGHVMGAVIIFFLVWWVEIQGAMRAKFLNKWRSFTRKFK